MWTSLKTALLYVADQTGIEVELGSRGTGRRGGEERGHYGKWSICLGTWGTVWKWKWDPLGYTASPKQQHSPLWGKMGIVLEGIFNVPFSAHLFQFLHYMQALKINHFCLNLKSAAVVPRDPTTALSVQKKEFHSMLNDFVAGVVVELLGNNACWCIPEFHVH